MMYHSAIIYSIFRSKVAWLYPFLSSCKAPQKVVNKSSTRSFKHFKHLSVCAAYSSRLFLLHWCRLHDNKDMMSAFCNHTMPGLSRIYSIIMLQTHLSSVASCMARCMASFMSFCMANRVSISSNSPRNDQMGVNVRADSSIPAIVASDTSVSWLLAGPVWTVCMRTGRMKSVVSSYDTYKQKYTSWILKMICMTTCKLLSTYSSTCKSAGIPLSVPWSAPDQKEFGKKKSIYSLMLFPWVGLSGRRRMVLPSPALSKLS